MASDEAVVKIILEEGASNNAKSPGQQFVPGGSGFNPDFAPSGSQTSNAGKNPPKTTTLKPFGSDTDLKPPKTGMDVSADTSIPSKATGKESGLDPSTIGIAPSQDALQIADSITQVVNDAVDIQQSLSQADNAYAKLKNVQQPEIELPFDPVALAKERVKREEELALVDAEYSKLKPPKPFDPYEAARQQRQREIESEQTEAAYQELFGGGTSTLDLINQLLGGSNSSFSRIGQSAIKGIKAAQQIGATNTTTSNAPPTAQVATGGGGSNVTSSIVGGGGGGGGSGGGGKPPGGGAGGMGGGGKAVGGMGGAAGGAAAAAGPIGVALLLKEAVDEIHNEIIGGIRGVVGGIGDIATAIASPNTDPSIPLGQVGQAASGVSEKLTYVSPMLAFMGVAVGEATKSLAGFMQALDQTAKRYGEYNVGIAQAQVVAEIRQTMGDFRRATIVSNEMVKYQRAQSDLQQRYEDIKVKVLTKILPLATDAVQMLEAVMKSGEGIVEVIGAIVAPLHEIAKVAKRMVNIEEDKKLKEPVDPTTALFLPEDHPQGVQVPQI